MVMEYIALGLFCLSLLVCLISGASIIFALAAGLVIFSVYALRKGFTMRQVAGFSAAGVKTVKNILISFVLIGMLTALWREAGTEGHSPAAWASCAVCALAVFFTLFYVRHVLHVTVEPNFWWYNFCGALWGAGVVLPGLTSSSIMMALGLYEPMMHGLADMQFLVLSACLPGMLLTMLLLARVVTWLFRRYYAAVFHGILGIVAASTLVIVPVRYGSWGEGLASAICCAAGFGVAYFLEKLDRSLPR